MVYNSFKKLNNFIFFVFLSLIAGVGCAHRNVCEEFNTKILHLESNFEKDRDTASMLSDLSNILSDDMECVDAYLARADLLSLVNKTTLAEADYKKALSLDHKNVYGMYKLAILYQDMELYDSSVVYFEKSIKSKLHGTVYVDYSTNKGLLSTKEGKYDVGILELKYQQGISFYYQRNLNAAIKNFDMCILHNYHLGYAYLYRGAVYAELNIFKKACEDFLASKQQGNTNAEEYINKYCK